MVCTYISKFFFSFSTKTIFCSTIDISIFCFTLNETLDGEAEYSSQDDDEGVWLGNKKSFERELLHLRHWILKQKRQLLLMSKRPQQNQKKC